MRKRTSTPTSLLHDDALTYARAANQHTADALRDARDGRMTDAATHRALARSYRDRLRIVASTSARVRREHLVGILAGEGMNA